MTSALLFRDRPRTSCEPLSLAAIGALLGDPIRAAILVHLTDGTRRPATELARLAGASPQAASAHLARLVDGGLLRVEPQGRHRFYALASGEAAEMIEGLTASTGPTRTVGGPGWHNPSLCRARFCYDHLAGRLGVAIFDRMVERGLLVLTAEGPGLSRDGLGWCRQHGIASPEDGTSRRPFLRLCRDWTERRTHAGGRFGAALAARLVEAGHVRRRRGERVADVTATGRAFLKRELEIGPLDR